MTTQEPVNLDALLKRNLVWDTVPYYAVAKLMPSMGLRSGSEEGNTHEEVRSRARLNALAPIQEELIHATSLAGEVIGRAILDNQGIEISGDTDPQLQQYMKIVHSGVLGVLAHLVASGSVTIQGEHSGFLG